MSTTGITSWAVDLSTIGTIYPFPGTEMLWFILGLAFWIIFHIWQIRFENRLYDEDMAHMKSPADFERALKQHRLD
ncbi:MAG: hypothetical protein R3F54_06600 [Alphaproteobacteria bacterium]